MDLFNKSKHIDDDELSKRIALGHVLEVIEYDRREEFFEFVSSRMLDSQSFLHRLDRGFIVFEDEFNFGTMIMLCSFVLTQRGIIADWVKVDGSYAVLHAFLLGFGTWIFYSIVILLIRAIISAAISRANKNKGTDHA